MKPVLVSIAVFLAFGYAAYRISFLMRLLALGGRENLMVNGRKLLQQPKEKQGEIERLDLLVAHLSMKRNYGNAPPAGPAGMSARLAMSI